MGTTKLTPGQKMALEIFLSSYEDSYPFEKLLDAVLNYDFEVVTIWEQAEYINTEALVDTIRDLAESLDAKYTIALRNN